MNFHSLLATEWRLIEPLSEFTPTADYTVYKSKKFPGFYGANGISIVRGGGRGLAEWEEVFDRYFERPLYEHKTFTFIKSDELLPLEDEARAAGYDVVQTSSFMAANPLPWNGEQQGIRRVQTEAEWNSYRVFYHETNQHESWYTPGGCDRLFDKMRYLTEAIDIHWLYVPGDTGNDVATMIGVFLCNGLARLQDVVTHPAYRRRGLATVLLSYVMAYAGGVLHAEKVVLCADTEYFAIDFYRRAGFEPVGETVDLMKYAVSRPV